eukprot:g3568.t1
MPWDSSVTRTSNLFDKKLEKNSIFKIRPKRRPVKDIEGDERRRVACVESPQKKSQTLKPNKMKKKKKKKVRILRAKSKRVKPKRRPTLRMRKNITNHTRAAKSRASILKDVVKNVCAASGDSPNIEDDDAVDGAPEFPVSPEEMARRREKDRMEILLANRIRRKILKRGRNRKWGGGGRDSNPLSIPLVSALERVARGVRPHRREVPVSHFLKLLEKPCYGELSKPSARWIVLFLGSDGMFVPFDNVLDFLTRRSCNVPKISTRSKTPPAKHRDGHENRSLRSSDRSSLHSSSSVSSDGDGVSMPPWERTVIEALQRAIRANRRLYSHELGPEDGTDASRMFRNAFEAFDVNGDGTVSHAEFCDALERLDICLTERQLSQLTQSIDRDADGRIDYKEFARVVRKKMNSSPTFSTATRLPPQRRGTWWGTYTEKKKASPSSFAVGDSAFEKNQSHESPGINRPRHHDGGGNDDGEVNVDDLRLNRAKFNADGAASRSKMPSMRSPRTLASDGRREDDAQRAEQYLRASERRQGVFLDALLDKLSTVIDQERRIERRLQTFDLEEATRVSENTRRIAATDDDAKSCPRIDGRHLTSTEKKDEEGLYRRLEASASMRRKQSRTREAVVSEIEASVVDGVLRDVACELLDFCVDTAEGIVASGV